MSEVGALIVKLRAETAEFREDMGKVKSDLDSLKGKAGEAGDAVDGSMRESAGSVRLLSHELGVPLPRELSRLIAEIPGIGMAFSTMLPLIGVIAAIAIISKLIEKQNELKKATQEAWSNMSTDAADALHSMDEELLQSAAKIDDLNGNHVAALEKRLKLLDDQKLDKLDSEFKKIAGEADKVLAGMHAGFFAAIQGKGEGVDEVKQQFDSLQARLQELKNAGNDKGFADALQGGIKAALARVDELNKHTSAFHKEERAALAAELEALVDQTQEYEKQSQITKNDKAAESMQDEDKWAIKLHRDHGELRKAREDAAKEAERENEEIANSQQAIANLVAESARKEAQENLKVSESYDAIAQARTKAAAEDAKSSVQSQASLGLITKQQEAQKLLAIDRQELADYQQTQDAKLQALRNYASEAAAIAQQAKGTNQEEATRSTAAQAQIAYNNAVAQGVKETQSLNDKISQQQLAAGKLQKSWAEYFGKMNQETASLGVELNSVLQTSVTKFTEGISQGFAKAIVEGKSLASAMRQLGIQILEEAISSLVQWKLMNAEKAGGAAFSNALAEGAPLPAALGIGAMAFGQALSFEVGGQIPGSGPVPIIGHGGETVVTKALTDRVNAAEGKGGSSKETHAHVHIHASAMDAEGMDRVLSKHSSIINKHVRSAMRKANH